MYISQGGIYLRVCIPQGVTVVCTRGVTVVCTRGVPGGVYPGVNSGVYPGVNSGVYPGVISVFGRKGGLLRIVIPSLGEKEACCAERYPSSLGERHAAQSGGPPPMGERGMLRREVDPSHG